MIRSPASAFNKKEMRNLRIFGVGWGAGLREPEGREFARLGDYDTNLASCRRKGARV